VIFIAKVIFTIVAIGLLYLAGCTSLPAPNESRSSQVTPAATNTLPAPEPTTSPTLAATPQPTGQIQGSEINVQANGSSGDPTGAPPSISAAGRWVVFTSRASNLAPGDTNECESGWAYEPSDGNCLDVFVRDVETGTTKRVSVASDGTQANGESFAPVVSADGRWVAFRSRASNLAPDYAEECAKRDYPGNCSGIFVHDRETGQTELLAVESDNGGLVPRPPNSAGLGRQLHCRPPQCNCGRNYATSSCRSTSSLSERKA